MIKKTGRVTKKKCLLLQKCGLGSLVFKRLINAFQQNVPSGREGTSSRADIWWWLVPVGQSQMPSDRQKASTFPFDTPPLNEEECIPGAQVLAFWLNLLSQEAPQ